MIILLKIDLINYLIAIGKSIAASLNSIEGNVYLSRLNWTTLFKTTIDLTSNPNNQGALNQDGAITAMTKLSECMVKHQEAVLRNQEEKKDTRLKAWHKLPEIQKNIILLGGVDDQG